MGKGHFNTWQPNLTPITNTKTLPLLTKCFLFFHFHAMHSNLSRSRIESIQYISVAAPLATIHCLKMFMLSQS